MTTSKSRPSGRRSDPPRWAWAVVALAWAATQTWAASPAQWRRVGSPGQAYVVADGRLEVALTLHAAAQPAFPLPVSSGLPLPQGTVRDVTALALLDASGEQVKAQLAPLAYWPDGSVKWVLVTFLAAEPSADGSFRLVLRGEPQSAEAGLTTEVSPQRTVVDTGALRAVFDRRAGGFIDSLAVDLDGNGRYDPTETIGTPAARSFVELVEVEPNGRPRAGRYTDTASLRQQIELVERGPLRAVVKITGAHTNPAGRATAPYTIWVSLYAGQRYFHLWHTFVSAEPASDVFVKALGVEVVMPGPATRFRVAHDGQTAVHDLGPEAAAYILQDDAAARRWPKLNQSKPRCRVVGVQSGSPRPLAEGRRCGGFLDVECGAMAAAVCLPRMWSEWPKELAVYNAGKVVRVCFWPEHKAGPLDLRPHIERGPPALAQFLATSEGRRWQMTRRLSRGPANMAMAKSHEMLCWFHGPDATPEQLAAAAAIVERPPLLVARPEYYEHCGLPQGFHLPDSANFSALDAKLTGNVDAMLEAREQFPWVGFLDYGDLPRSYSEATRAWDRMGAGWTNGASEVAYTFFVQFLKTGDPRHFDVASAGARHLMDVDTLHGLGPGAASGMPCRPGPDHSAAGDLSHASPLSIVLYHYLTGSRRAEDVMHELLALIPAVGDLSLGDRELSQAVVLAAAYAEMAGSAEATERLASYSSQLCLRLRHMGLDPGTSRVVNLSTGRPYDADLDEYLLPALAYANGVTQDPDTVAVLQHCVRVAWPAFDCLPALAALYRATGDGAYAQAAAYSLSRRLRRARAGTDVTWWTEQELGRASWLQTSETMALLYRTQPRLHPERLARTASPTDPRAKPSPAGPARDRAFVPIDLAAAATSSVSPWAGAAQPDGIKLGVGETGFDFGVRMGAEPGFVPVTPQDLFPSSPGDVPGGVGFAGVPAGATARYAGVPFQVVKAAEGGGPAAVALQRDKPLTLAVGRRVNALHVLGGVCLARSVDSQSGASLVLRYANGQAETVTLRNFEHYQPAAYPPLFVGSDVRSAAQLGQWHLNVLRIPAKEDLLDQVQFVAGPADHKLAVLAVTAEASEPVVPVGALIEVNWTTVGAGVATKTLSARLPEGRYTFDLDLRADAGVAIDVDVAEERVVRHAVPNGRLLVTTAPVSVRDRAVLTCRARRVAGAGSAHWDVAVAGVRRVAEPTGEAEPAAVARARRHGWLCMAGTMPAPVTRPHALALRPRSPYQPGRLFGDGCAPLDAHRRQLSFACEAPNGRYQVGLYLRPESSGACRVTVSAEGEQKLTAHSVPAATDGAGYRAVKPVRFDVDVLDGRLDIDFAQARSDARGARWVLCALVTKYLGPVEIDDAEE